MSHSARASWARSLIPVSRPSSSVSSAATIRPSSRANATRSVRYSSPVVVDGRRSPIRRRSHAASIAYSPALISAIWRSSSVASLSSTIRSTVPPSLRTTRPRPVGSRASTETRAIAAWSRPRSSSSEDSRSAWTSGTSPDSDEDLLDVVGELPERGAQRVAGAPRLVLERRVRPVLDRGPDGIGGLRVDDDGPAVRRAGGRVEHVVDHRPAADRVEDLRDPGLHARAQPGREDDGHRAPDRRPGT